MQENVTDEMKQLLKEELAQLLAEVKAEVDRKKSLMPKAEETSFKKRRY